MVGIIANDPHDGEPRTNVPVQRTRKKSLSMVAAGAKDDSPFVALGQGRFIRNPQRCIDELQNLRLVQTSIDHGHVGFAKRVFEFRQLVVNEPLQVSS